MPKAKKSVEGTRLAKQRPAWSDVLVCGEEQESHPPNHQVSKANEPPTRKNPKSQMQNRRLTRDELVVKETAYTQSLSVQQKHDQDEGWNDSVWDGFSSGNEGTTMTGKRSSHGNSGHSGDLPDSDEVVTQPSTPAQRQTHPDQSVSEGVGQMWNLRAQEKNTFLDFDFPDGQEETAFSPRARSEPDVCGGQGGSHAYQSMQGSLAFLSGRAAGPHSMSPPGTCSGDSQFQEHLPRMYEQTMSQGHLDVHYWPMPAGQGIQSMQLHDAAASIAQRTSTSTGTKGVVASMDPEAQAQELHETGRCKPCAFLTTVGCRHGSTCEFCHLRHGRGHPRASKAKRHRFKRLVARTIDADQKWFNDGDRTAFNYSQDSRMARDGRTGAVPYSQSMSYASGVSLSASYAFGKEMPRSQAGYGPPGGRPQFEAPRNVCAPLAPGILSPWPQQMFSWDRSGVSY